MRRQVRARREIRIVGLGGLRRTELSYFKPFERDIEEVVDHARGNGLEVARHVGAAAVFRHDETAVFDPRRLDASR